MGSKTLIQYFDAVLDGYKLHWWQGWRDDEPLRQPPHKKDHEWASWTHGVTAQTDTIGDELADAWADELIHVFDNTGSVGFDRFVDRMARQTGYLVHDIASAIRNRCDHRAVESLGFCCECRICKKRWCAATDMDRTWSALPMINRYPFMLFARGK